VLVLTRASRIIQSSGILRVNARPVWVFARQCDEEGIVPEH